MRQQLYKSSERGKADFGWLKANFSFSFGNYFNPDKVQFGMLRVLNDDTIAAGMGFGTHPHDNMEIITIPLEGGLKHRDSMGNEAVVRFGEVQVMSAGTGILHSEMNPSGTEPAKTLQLWVFPEKQNVAPRYDQKSFDLKNSLNSFVNVVSPYDKNDGNALWVYQQTFFNLGVFEAGKTIEYKINIAGNGVYIFLIEGETAVSGTTLLPRDAIGITETETIELKIRQQSKILLIEIPMQQN
ncbi:pirin family protein [Flavobacterium sp. 3HN19-14]|uniref:pirin family protein n=1 Tax=Flavobacterium sp. 3HN19-14 TaxID=3448133 RepID=UPI003EE1B37B